MKKHRSKLIFGSLILPMVFTSCGGHPASTAAITIKPVSANVPVGQTQSFQAYIDGTVVTSPVTWQVNGSTGGNSSVGTISSFGLYTAPNLVPSPQNVTITAIAEANSSQTATATATVGPFISISPPLAEVQTYGTQQFAASVTGISNTAVTWQINCHEGGTACGAVSQTGLYRAPNSVPTTVLASGDTATEGVNLIAVSQAMPAFSGSTVVGISSLNQQSQAIPVLLGSSGSNANNVCVNANVGSCITGTLGALVTRGGTQYVLSNSHVLTESGGGTVGDAVIQPGLNDTQPMCSTTGTATVAHLSQSTNPQTDTGNIVDAALAQVVSGAVDSSGTIEELGAAVVNGVPQAGAPAQGSGISASVNELVAKSGRSTGLTCSTVEAINVSVKIQLQTPCSSSASTITFPDEVAISGAGFSAGGDSGSLIVDANTAQPIALLFADDATTTFGNPISDVLSALKDSNNNVPSFVGGAPHIVAACSLPAPTAATAMDERASRTGAIWTAEEIRNRHASELFANQGVAAIGVGPSLDAPAEPAILLFVKSVGVESLLPQVLEGVRTRIIVTNRPEVTGILNSQESYQFASSGNLNNQLPLSTVAVSEAIAAKGKHAAKWMTDPAVQAVGVGASLDSPGDPVLLFYILDAWPHSPIPTTVDSIRTRIKYTSGFHAGASNVRMAGHCLR